MSSLYHARFRIDQLRATRRFTSRTIDFSSTNEIARSAELNARNAMSYGRCQTRRECTNQVVKRNRRRSRRSWPCCDIGEIVVVLPVDERTQLANDFEC